MVHLDVPQQISRELPAWMLDASICSAMLRISANVTADFGNVTDSAGLGVARC
ncbi:hypothetical protein WCQ02_39690 [Paraburkholderia tropica]|uniref:hypothetical protein n=1 Tax=Paraburkholderia tropica TaxID=92647 RepID=UPI003017250B